MKFSEKHIKEKDELLSLYYTKRMSIREIAELKGYKEGTLKECFRDWEYVARNNRERHKKYFCNESYFHNIDCEHKAYWLGYIAADGTVLDKTKSENSQRLKLCLAREDEELLYKFKEDIQATYPIGQYKNSCHYAKETWIGQPISQITIPSEQIYNDLVSHNITPRKSLTIIFPETMKDNQYVNAFIRGYFDGDGCISQNKSTSKSRDYNYKVTIKGTQSMLYNFRKISGVSGTIKASGKHADFRNKELVIVKHKDMKDFLNFIYKDSTIHLQRKYERYLLVLKNY